METEAIHTGKKLQVSKQVKDKFDEVKAELKSREVTGFTFTTFLDQVFAKTKDSVFLEIIEENTPAHFRITEASKDPILMDELLKVIEKNKKRQSKIEV